MKILGVQIAAERSNMSIIIERGVYPSYEFLRNIWDSRFEGEDILFSNELPRLIDTQTLEECVRSKDLSLFEWICRNFSVKDFSLIYRLCLVDHIEIAERYNTSLREYSRIITMKDAEVSDVVNYINWLIAIGRALYLLPEVFFSLICGLALSEVNEVDAARDLLFVILVIPEESRRRFLKLLLPELQSRDQEGGKVDTLFSIMAEVGIMSGRCGLYSILELEASGAYFPQHLIEGLWNTTRNTSALDTPFGALRVSLELLLDQDNMFLNSSDIIQRVFANVIYLDMRFGCITGKYSLLVLNHLLDQVSIRIPGRISVWASQMIHKGILMPSTLSRSQSVELTYKVLSCGDNRTIEDFHKYFAIKYGVSKDDYLRTANAVLRNLAMSQERRCGLRAAILICSLRENASLNFLHKITARNLILEFVDSTLTVLKTLKNSADLADLILSRYIGSRTITARHGQLIEDHLDFIGKKTIRAMLSTDAKCLLANMSSALKEKIAGHMRDDIRYFLDLILRTRGEALSFGFDNPFGECMYRVSEHLVLGSRVYTDDPEEGDAITWINRRRISTGDNYCRGCYKEYDNEFYHHDSDRHGVYYCRSCAKPGSKIVTCGICLSEEANLEMKILLCRHVFCTECILGLYHRGRPLSCPVCRLCISVSTEEILLSYEEAAEGFLREWSTSPAVTRDKALASKLMLTVESESDIDD